MVEVGQIVIGLIPNEAAKITKIRKLGDKYSVAYIGVNSNLSSSKVLSQIQLDSLSTITTEGSFNFKGDPERFVLYAEAERIKSAYQFDPLFAINCSVVDPLPHQVEAVYKYLLPQPKIRFLLADDTGAGKTIMTGLLLKELLMRGIIERVLIVTPGGLTKQWQEDEMGIKFNIPFTLVNRSTFSAEPTIFQDKNRVVASIDFMCREDVMKVLSKTNWDIIIFDEAHKLSAYDYGEKTYRSRRYEVAELLSQRCEHILLLTATPHRGRADTFKRLMQLLDEDIFATPELAAERVKEMSQDGINKFFIRRLKEDMRDWDGQPLYKARFTQTVSYELSPAEMKLYDAVTKYLTQRKAEAANSKNIHVTLALQVMQRRLVSSIFAIKNTLERRWKALQGLAEALRQNPALWKQRSKIDDFDNLDSIDDYDELDDQEREALDKIMDDPRKLKMFTTAKSPAEISEEAKEVKALYELAAELYNSNVEERKYQQLKQLLNAHGVIDGEKLVIFTEHKDTLIYLEQRLRNSGYSVATIHGGMAVDERREAQCRFKTPDVQILIATDAAGEGINLQFCRLLINWDIPWNPNRLEQRMGRIHRYGQKEDVIVFNMVADNTREGKVLATLLSKLQMIRDHLGDDRVYDVIQDVLKDVSLEDIISSVFNGENSDFSNFVNQDTNTMSELFKKSITEQANRIAHSEVDYSHARELKEDSDERRLQPIYIRQFFERAFRYLGGRYTETTPGIFRIDSIPDVLAKYIKSHYNFYVEGITDLIFFFDKHAFIQYRESNPVFGRAHYINPGNPLFDALVEVVRDKFRTDMLRGTVLISPDDRDPFFAFFIRNQITDNRDNKEGENIANELLALVCQDSDGNFHQTSPAKFLDLFPPNKFAKQVTPPAVTTEDDVLQWAFTNITEPLFNQTAEKVAEDSAKRKEYLRTAFEQIIIDITAKVNELQSRLFFDEGSKLEEKMKSLMESIEKLKARRTQRIEELDNMVELTPKEPEVLGCAYVIPLSDVEYRSNFGMSRDDDVERIAMNLAMEYERAHGRQPEDVSSENVGYDIRSLASDGTKRYIEVKGRSGTDGVMLSENERNRLGQLGRRAWLYIVTDCKSTPVLNIIQDPGNTLQFEEHFRGVQYFLPLANWQDNITELEP
jgi:helicase domain-containing protein